MDVSFDLERFRWVEEGRLEVVGRWTGLRSRRGRPVLHVGGRRVSGQVLSEDPWRAVFAYEGEADGAELEVGRIVVDLPRPRRLRRRATTEGPAADAGELAGALAKVDALREDLAAAQAEAAAAREDADAARAELAAVPTERGDVPDAAELERVRSEHDSELAGLRLAHGSLRASHEQLEDEVEELRGVREERDRLAGELEQLRATGADEERAKADLGDVIRQLQDRASESDSAREHLMGELTTAREEIATLRASLDERETELAEARADAAERVDAERAATTEVHSRLATAREQAERTVAVEAEETERLRHELDIAREDAERLLAGERAEVARLREELISRDGEEDEATRRMVERIGRDLDRERAAARELRRELDDLRSETARQRREGGNGTATLEDRGVRPPERTQRRADAARAASARRVPQVPPNPISLWAVRVVAALTVAALGIALVVLLSALT
jgi:chromosome segregation ATPase